MAFICFSALFILRLLRLIGRVLYTVVLRVFAFFSKHKGVSSCVGISSSSSFFGDGGGAIKYSIGMDILRLADGLNNNMEHELPHMKISDVHYAGSILQLANSVDAMLKDMRSGRLDFDPDLLQRDIHLDALYQNNLCDLTLSAGFEVHGASVCEQMITPSVLCDLSVLKQVDMLPELNHYPELEHLMQHERQNTYSSIKLCGTPILSEGISHGLSSCCHTSMLDCSTAEMAISAHSMVIAEPMAILGLC